MKLHPVIASLVDEIEAFRSQTGMSKSALGKGAINDPKLIDDMLNRGRLPSVATMDRVRDFMRAHVGAA